MAKATARTDTNTIQPLRLVDVDIEGLLFDWALCLILEQTTTSPTIARYSLYTGTRPRTASDSETIGSVRPTFFRRTIGVPTVKLMKSLRFFMRLLETD